MFRKIITNLPFQPALLGQLSLYIRHINKEEYLRKIGFILVVIIFVIQPFFILSPPKASLTTSTADIIYGASSQQDILQSYYNDRDMFGRTDIQEIYNYYGVELKQISSAKNTTITKAEANNYINTSRVPSNISDTFISIPGASSGGVYEYPLALWENGNNKASYPALTGMSTFGFRFWILLNGSGNIVFEQGAKKPSFEITRKLTSNPSPAPGEITAYSILFRNNGKAIAENTTITSRLPSEFEYKSYTSNTDLTLKQDGQQLTWETVTKNGSLAPSTKWYTIDINVKLKNAQNAEQKSCDINSISSSNGPLVYTSDAESAQCITVKKQTCPGTGTSIPENDPAKCVITCPDGSTSTYSNVCAIPQLSCESLQRVSSNGWDSKNYKTNIIKQKGAIAQKITYYVNNKIVYSEPISTSLKTHNFSYTYPFPGNYTIRAELAGQDGSVQPSQNCSINETISSIPNPETRIITASTVSNVTQKISDASGTTAKAGDILKYSLSLTNRGETTLNNFALAGEYSENISDILEYADILEKYDAKFDGKTGMLSWPSVDIKPNETINKVFTVAIKNTSSSTPISKSNPLSYDYKINNTFGSTTTIKLNKPISKNIELAMTKLSKTNNYIVLAISALALLVIGYLYIRSRLLRKEAEIIHKEFSSGGL